jgi:DNA-binding transcriptional ArsR family regulator
VPEARSRSATLDEIEAVFFALGHETRRHIVLLLGHSGGELPSGYLAKRFPHSWPTITRHLNVLESARVVEVKRRGRSSLYRLDRERVRRVLGDWLDNLDPPTPTATWKPSGPRSAGALATTTRNRTKGRRR